MAATVQTISTNTNSGDDDTAVVITKPGGTVDGDLLVAQIVSNRLTANFTATGWTLIQDTANDSTTDGGRRMLTYYKVASSEGANYTFSQDASGDIAGGIVRINGQTPSSAVATSSEQATNTAGTTATGSTVTPASTNSLILLFFGTGAGGISTSAYAIATSNPSWTEGWDISTSADVSFAFAYANRPEITATGNATATLSASRKHVVQVVSISGNLTDAVPAGVLTLSGPAPGWDLSDTLSVGTLTLSGPAVTSTATERNIANVDKSSAPSWVNVTKS